MEYPINKVQLTGTIVREITTRTVNGSPVANFTILTESPGFQGKTTKGYHKCSLWGSQATELARTAKEGSRISVTGSLGFNKWTDKEGVQHNDAQINVQGWIPALETAVTSEELNALADIPF